MNEKYLLSLPKIAKKIAIGLFLFLCLLSFVFNIYFVTTFVGFVKIKKDFMGFFIENNGVSQVNSNAQINDENSVEFEVIKPSKKRLQDLKVKQETIDAKKKLSKQYERMFATEKKKSEEKKQYKELITEAKEIRNIIKKSYEIQN